MGTSGSEERRWRGGSDGWNETVTPAQHRILDRNQTCFIETCIVPALFAHAGAPLLCILLISVCLGSVSRTLSKIHSKATALSLTTARARKYEGQR
jgi:hypothetical protein